MKAGGLGRRTVVLLVVANLAVVGAIFALLSHRRGGAWWAIGGEPSAEDVDWTHRFAAGASDDPTCAGCNVLMVSLDIFRPDHMPCMGYPQATTPNICAMADQGTLFESFIAHAYQTPVAQMALFTGRYPSRSGFVSFGSVLKPEVGYLPEALKTAGYNTVAMGSSFEVMTDMSSVQEGRMRFTRQGLNPGLSFGRGFDRFVFTGNRNLPTDAIPWIQEHGDEKFFLWLILGTLHWPYGEQGDPTLKTMFDPPGYDGPLAERNKLSFEVLSRIYKGRMYDRKQEGWVPLTPADAAFINARYDFGLWTVDRFIGELLAAIPSEVLQNTIILLHGVHGEDLGEHGYFGHYDIYDTEVRNTLVMLDPRQRVAGQRIAEQVESVDLAPTLLEMLGLPPLGDVDGHSFVDVLRTGRGDPRRSAFFERIPLWEDIFRFRSQMPERYTLEISPILDEAVWGDTGMRTNEWKLLHRTARDVEAQVSWWTYLSGEPVERREWELYDLVADPTEQRDVLFEHADIAVKMKRELDAWEDAVMHGQRAPSRPHTTVGP